jgi:hypothetical protein
MKIVPDWREAWKWLSIQLVALGIALQGAVLAFPDLKDWLGDTATHLVGILILAGVAMGRLKDQSKP